MKESLKKVSKLKEAISSVILGKSEVIDLVLISLLSDGHILLEDAPGVGKTTLAKALAFSISSNFKRIQFTPDLLPGDILGTYIFNPKTAEFKFKEGPIFTNILLADEINRASPRTQSALLEGMNERQVSIEGNRFKLTRPFIVIATQNPIEFTGTYPLPEAQLDRFFMKITIGYPDLKTESDILNSQRKEHPIDKLEAVLTTKEIIEIQEEVKDIIVKPPITEYISLLAANTRKHESLDLGISPRGALFLYRGVQAAAFLDERDYVIPEDVKSVAIPILSHRIFLHSKAKYSGEDKEEIIHDILKKTPVKF
ncbi:MoxR family ATPase [Candidatus Dependentiae bacterium]|nr:MoxR family ATPase [Candidatus Dependentiae bacterium]